MIKRVGMLILLESDLNAAISFYTALGILLKFHLKDSWAEFEIGNVKLGLCPTTKVATETVTGIVLEVDNLMQMYTQLKDSIEFRSAPIEKVHGIMVSIKDPGGNILDLYEPTPEKVRNLINTVKEGEEIPDEFKGMDGRNFSPEDESSIN